MNSEEPEFVFADQLGAGRPVLGQRPAGEEGDLVVAEHLGEEGIGGKGGFGVHRYGRISVGPS